MRSQTSLDINIVLVRAAHCGQLEKPMSFLCLLLGVLKSMLIKAFVGVVNGSIALVEFVRAYR